MVVTRRPWRMLLLVSLPATIVALLVLALATEVWVRARWDPRRGRPGFYLSDAVRGERLAPNYDGWFAGVPVHIDSLELRDPREYALEKKPNTFRILVLGDSVTFGHGSVYERTYPYLTEQMLRRWRPDIDWQVWNAGVPGYNTSQELAQLVDVGPRFQPDLVIVGFYENDVIGNERPRTASLPERAWAQILSAARRHIYSLELYKRTYLTLAWRMSASEAYRRRLEHLPTETSLLRMADATSPRQELTTFDRLTDEEVRAVDCKYGMRAGAEVIDAIKHEPTYDAWVDAVRQLQAFNRTGRYHIGFFINHVPPVCPDGDVFYDGGAKRLDRFYLDMMSDGTPAVSSFDAFLRVRPSQMPDAREHAIGNANLVKAEVLFAFLRDRLLPGRLPAPHGQPVE